MPLKKAKYGKRSAYRKSQRLYIDTCLRQDVFHGWLALPLQNPEKRKITEKIHRSLADPRNVKAFCSSVP